MKIIASALAVSLLAFAEPSFATTIAGQASQYFDADAAVSITASVLAAGIMLAVNLLSRRRESQVARVRVYANTQRAYGAYPKQ
jgi:Zn-dependent protease with chaperone function